MTERLIRRRHRRRRHGGRQPWAWHWRRSDCASPSWKRFRITQRRSRASMSAPRHCRTAAAGSWRPWACGRSSIASATPIAKIHVSDQGRFGFARIDAAEQGLAAMGYVVPNRALGSALWSRL